MEAMRTGPQDALFVQRRRGAYVKKIEPFTCQQRLQVSIATYGWKEPV
jgi:hypothetical protein